MDDWISTEVMVDPQILLRFDKSTGSKGVLFERIPKIINGMIVSIKWIKTHIAKCNPFLSFSKHPNVL